MWRNNYDAYKDILLVTCTINAKHTRECHVAFLSASVDFRKIRLQVYDPHLRLLLLSLCQNRGPRRFYHGDCNLFDEDSR
jgi:hypothetical protein